MSALANSRPRNVAVAVAILCVVLAYWLVSGVAQTVYATVTPPLSRSIVYAFGLAGVCVNAFFIYKIFKGRNWARVIYSVFVLLAVLFAVRGFAAFLGRSPAWAMLSLVGHLAQAVALVLLFTKSSGAWFKPRGA